MGISPEIQRASAGVRAAARDALEAGSRFLVAIGDDSTVREVVDAMMERDDHPDLMLGVIPTSDCDLMRTFGLPQDPLQACAYLSGAEEYALDIGTAVATGPQGDRVTARFAIIAEVGFGAEVLLRTSNLPSFLGRGRRFLAFWAGLARSRTRIVEVTVGGKVYEGPAYNLVVGNCQFFGGGLRMSPRSYPGDGILDVLVMTGPRSEAFTQLPKMSRGEHIPSSTISELRGREVRVACKKALPVHADGKVLGTTPASFSLTPKALRLKV
jgi:diacylglycerol kinase family enzyme